MKFTIQSVEKFDGVVGQDNRVIIVSHDVEFYGKRIQFTNLDESDELNSFNQMCGGDIKMAFIETDNIFLMHLDKCHTIENYFNEEYWTNAFAVEFGIDLPFNVLQGIVSEYHELKNNVAEKMLTYVKSLRGGENV